MNKDVLETALQYAIKKDLQDQEGLEMNYLHPVYADDYLLGEDINTIKIL
jgi:hypothetical protein